MARRIELPKIPSGANIGVSALSTLIRDAKGDDLRAQTLALKSLKTGLKIRSNIPEEIVWLAERSLANVANW